MSIITAITILIMGIVLGFMIVYIPFIAIMWLKEKHAKQSHKKKMRQLETEYNQMLEQYHINQKGQ